MQKPDEVPAEGLVRDTGHPPARSLACLPPGVLARQGKRAVLAVPKCPWPPMLALSPPAGKALAGQRLPCSRSAGPGTCPKDLQVQRASQRNPSAWRRCSPCSRIPHSQELSALWQARGGLAAWAWEEAAGFLPSTLRPLESACHRGAS